MPDLRATIRMMKSAADYSWRNRECHKIQARVKFRWLSLGCAKPALPDKRPLSQTCEYMFAGRRLAVWREKMH